MSLEAQKLRYGKYSLWYSDGYIWCSDGTDTYKMRIDAGGSGEVVPYDPTVDKSLLPYNNNGVIEYKFQTVVSCLDDILRQVINSTTPRYLNDNLEFTEDNVNVLTSLSICGKKITGVIGPDDNPDEEEEVEPWPGQGIKARALSDGFSLMSWEYFDAHKNELKGDTGPRGPKVPKVHKVPKVLRVRMV